ncbi:hypothetical protein B0T24DRAFT_624472 [Lasiosphaeria ovina]|uniref:Uncharacterized protein n=1 Tax=Lasiosphaeria ovina TaxID=92902 RepID=A0AAE0KBH0_9PEZI|nr:hypothetical protein B0T24DRAFT_624472 [Lasiosphaeria ovina]
MKPSCFLTAAPWWLLVLPGLGFPHLGPPDNFWAAALAVGERHHQPQQTISRTHGNHGRSGVDTTAQAATREADFHHDAGDAKWSCFLASRHGAAVDAGSLEDGLDSGEARVCDTTKGRWSQAWQMTSQTTWQVLNLTRAFETTSKALSLNFTLLQDSDGASQRCLMSIPNTGPKESWYHAWCKGSDNAGVGSNSVKSTGSNRITSSNNEYTGSNSNGKGVNGVIGDGVFTISWGYVNGSADGAVMTVCNPATGTDAWFGFDHVNTQQNFPSSPKETVYDTGCS